MATLDFLSRLRITAWAGAALASLALGCSHAQPAPDDSLLVAARTAAQTGNWDTLRNLARQVQGHPLATYPVYWDLRGQLNDPRQPTPTAALEAFFAEHKGTYLAERLRYDWILAAARQFDYAAIAAQADTTVSTPQSECAILHARHVLGQRVRPAQAIAAFKPGDTCWALYDRLHADGAMPWRDFANQLRDLIETNTLDHARRMARYVFAGEQLKAFPAALDKPMPWLVRQNPAQLDTAGRELAVIALARAGRSDIRVGGEYFERNWARRLPEADAKWIRNHLALVSALRLDTGALDWYRAGEGIPLTDYNHPWRVRAALRAQPVDWAAVKRYVGQMPAHLRDDPAWDYWLGRALVATGSPAEGQARFRAIAGQYNFYGQLAAEELGLATTIPVSAAPVTPDELSRAQYDPALQRALALFRLGWRTEAVREWNFALRGMDDRQLLAAAHLAHRNGLYDRAVNTAERTREQHDFNLRFLAPFRDRMTEKTRDAGLDETWVYGLIRQESRFVQDARSHVGASGLMQLMPATARWVARRIGMTDFTPRAVNDFDTNLTLGTHYLRFVLDDVGGSALLASAGYNAGPRRPHAWRGALPGPVEGALFAETIPFTETRDYVKKVLSNATYYAALFTGQPQSLKARLGQVVPQQDESTSLP